MNWKLVNKGKDNEVTLSSFSCFQDVIGYPTLPYFFKSLLLPLLRGLVVYCPLVQSSVQAWNSTEARKIQCKPTVCSILSISFPLWQNFENLPEFHRGLPLVMRLRAVLLLREDPRGSKRKRTRKVEPWNHLPFSLFVYVFPRVCLSNRLLSAL